MCYKKRKKGNNISIGVKRDFIMDLVNIFDLIVFGMILYLGLIVVPTIFEYRENHKLNNNK